MTPSHVELGLIIASSRNEYYLPWKAVIPEILTRPVPNDCYINWVVRMQEAGSTEKFMFPLKAHDKAPLLHRHRNNRVEVFLESCWQNEEGTISTEVPSMVWPITDPEGFLQPPDLNRRYTAWGRVVMDSVRDISVQIVEIVDSKLTVPNAKSQYTLINSRISFQEPYNMNQKTFHQDVAAERQENEANIKGERSNDTMFVKILRILFLQKETREVILRLDPQAFNEIIEIFDVNNF